MRSRVAGGALAVVVVGGAVVGLSATTAEAKSKPCALGTWRLSEEKVVVNESGPGFSSRFSLTGAEGSRLTIRTSSVSLDYSHAKPEYFTVAANGHQQVERNDYRGGLALRSHLSGTTFRVDYPSASGNATRTSNQLSPTKKKLGTTKLAAALRAKSTVDTQLPATSTLKCIGTWLRLSVKPQLPNHLTATGTYTLTFRRT